MKIRRVDLMVAWLCTCLCSCLELSWKQLMVTVFPRPVPTLSLSLSLSLAFFLPSSFSPVFPSPFFLFFTFLLSFLRFPFPFPCLNTIFCLVGITNAHLEPSLLRLRNQCVMSGQIPGFIDVNTLHYCM